MSTPTKAVKVNPVSGALIDPPVATFCSANGIAKLSDLTSFFDYKGGQDCSGNPNYPAALKGDVYSVTVAGKIGGASGVVVAVGDTFLATADNAGGTQSAVGTSWIVSQANIDLANIAITGGTINGTVIGGSTPAAGTFTTINGLTISTTTGTLTIWSLVPVEFQQQFQTIGTFYAGGDVYISDALTTAGDVIFSGAYNATFTLTANTAVTFPTTGTLLSTAAIGVSVQAYDADLTTWAGITPAAGVGTFLATPSGANLASALTSALPESKGGTGWTSMVKFHAYKTADQTTTGGSYEQITFPSEEFDTGGNFASSAFTAPVAGKYRFSCNLYCSTGARIANIALYKNGTQIKRLASSGGTRAGDIMSGSVAVNLAANDVITIYSYTDGAMTYAGAQTIAYFCGELLPGS